MPGFVLESELLMKLLHESRVVEEEIDSLGHMNVRYYISRMEAANRVLLQGLGLQSADGETYLRRTDTYTRFLREQFEGARLHALGGVLAVTEGGMQSYVEICNPDSGDRAATFITTTSLVDRRTRRTLPMALPADGSGGAADGALMDLPDYARPRSLHLGVYTGHATLDELDACIPEVEGGGMMSGKRTAVIEPEDVDEDGWLRDDVELMFLPFARMAAQSQAQHGPPVFQTEDGKRVGWAVMEQRTVSLGQPRLGDEIAYFSADLQLKEKTRTSRRWAFQRASGELLGFSDSVGLCIDLDARRAIPWPRSLREQIERHQQPQFAADLIDTGR